MAKKPRSILGSDAPTRFSWDATTHRFRNRDSGAFVSRVETRQKLDSIVDKSAERMTALTKSLRNSDITIADWQEAMTSEIKTMHIVFASAAHGGWNNMTLNDWDRVTNEIEIQNLYLRDFAEQVYTGEQRNDGTMLVRSKLYAESARVTYEQERRQLEVDTGATQERNLLGGSDHCNGCQEATLAGWVDIGTLVPIGYRECVSKCRCFMLYRKGPSDRLGSDFSE